MHETAFMIGLPPRELLRGASLNMEGVKLNCLDDLPLGPEQARNSEFGSGRSLA
ncbi:hypothetical protein PQR62_07455 [Herbaspirillum lusitanum]|uniref:Uncharacterized protein n=1 Tax=Herbaspirillum lusitanum TaxID=213312 RepID=A0ABW9A7A2_9BURK